MRAFLVSHFNQRLRRQDVSLKAACYWFANGQAHEYDLAELWSVTGDTMSSAYLLDVFQQLQTNGESGMVLLSPGVPADFGQVVDGRGRWTLVFVQDTSIEVEVWGTRRTRAGEPPVDLMRYAHQQWVHPLEPIFASDRQDIEEALASRLTRWCTRQRPQIWNAPLTTTLSPISNPLAFADQGWDPGWQVGH